MKFNSLKEVITISTAIKMFITALLGVIGGSSYFAAISNFATYYYSVEQGFRLPSEGSPYLKIAISSLTFTFLSSAAVIFIILHLFSIVAKQYFLKTNSLIKWSIKKAKRTNRRRMYLVFFWFFKSSRKPINLKFTFCMSVIYTAAFFILLKIVPPTPLPWRFTLIGSLIIGSYPFMLSLPFLKRDYRILVCSGIVLLYLAAGPTILFDNVSYAKILNIIKYGGGTPVELHFEKNKSLNANLVFRSSESLFIKTNEKSITEIPLREINSIDYLVATEVEISSK